MGPQGQNPLGPPSPLRAPASTPRANRGTAWKQAHVGRVHLACLTNKGAWHPRTLIPTTAVSKASEKGRRQPYVQKQALIREEAVPVLQARLLRVKIRSH